MTEPTDEERWIYWAVHYCGSAPDEARAMAQDHPEWVEAWNDVRRDHERRDRREAMRAARPVTAL